MVYALVFKVSVYGLPTCPTGMVTALKTGVLTIVKVKACAAVATVFFALRVRVYTPAAVPLGVPEMVGVPLPLSTKLTPAGRAPVLLRVGTG